MSCLSGLVTEVLMHAALEYQKLQGLPTIRCSEM